MTHPSALKPSSGPGGGPESGDHTDAIEKRERWHRKIDLGRFIDIRDHDGSQVREVAIVVNKKDDEWMGQREAHAEFDARAQSMPGGKASFAEDETLLEDMKDVFVTFKAFRKANDLDQFAFRGGANWMAANLDTEEIGTLVRLCNRARTQKGGAPWEMPLSFVVAMRGVIADFRDGGHPQDSELNDWPLAQYSRAYVDLLLVESMWLWRKEAESLTRENEELARRVAELEGNTDEVAPAEPSTSESQ